MINHNKPPKRHRFARLRTANRLQGTANLPRISVPSMPRIDDSQASGDKIRRVARGDRETMRLGDRCDKSICGCNGLPSRASAGTQRCVGSRCRIIERQNTTRKQRQQALLKTGCEHIPPFSFRQHSDTQTQFCKTDGREVQRFDNLRVYLSRCPPAKAIPAR